MRRHTLDPDRLDVVSFDPIPSDLATGRALPPANAGTLVGLSCVGISCEVNCATAVGRPC